MGNNRESQKNQATLLTLLRLSGVPAGGPTNQRAQRVRAKITAASSGRYSVAVLEASGAEGDETYSNLTAFPPGATLQVGDYVWLQFMDSDVPIVEAAQAGGDALDIGIAGSIRYFAGE